MRAADGGEPTAPDPVDAEVLHRRITRARKAGVSITAALPAAFVRLLDLHRVAMHRDVDGAGRAQ